jgi:hypothetical protein
MAYKAAPKGNAFSYSSGKYKSGSFVTTEVDINAPMVSEAYPAMKIRDTNQQERRDAQEILGVSGYRPLKKGLFISDKEYVKQYNQEEGNDNTRTIYGFRFLYNPTTISMGYGFADGFDPSLLLSGQDPTNFVTPIQGSTFQFSLMINRIDDMKYLDKTGIPSKHNPYPRQISDDTAKKIRKMGTMYDIEYLLSVISGYKLKTKFRGNTADFGYLGGTPFLMKLNEYMKYSVYCSGITLDHAMFDHRMVPILTNVSLTLTRYVDNAVATSNDDPPPATKKKKTTNTGTSGTGTGGATVRAPKTINGKTNRLAGKALPAAVDGGPAAAIIAAQTVQRTFVVPYGTTLYAQISGKPETLNISAAGILDENINRFIRYLKLKKYKYNAHIKVNSKGVKVPVISFVMPLNEDLPTWVDLP